MSNNDTHRDAKANAKAAKAYAKAQRPWFKKKRFVIPILGGIFLVGAMTAGGGGGETPDTASESVSAPQKAAGSAEAPEAKKAAPAPEKATWHRLAVLKGSADKTSDTIKTSGGKVRLRYTFSGASEYGGIGAIYFLEEGTDLQKDGGFPEVTVSENAKDSIILRKGAGEYFLDVTSTMRYSIIVEELR